MRRSAERRTHTLTHTVSAPRHAFGSSVRSANDTLIHSVSAGFAMFRFIHHEKSVLCLQLPRRNTILHRKGRLLSLPASASASPGALTRFPHPRNVPLTIQAHRRGGGTGSTDTCTPPPTGPQPCGDLH